MAYFWGHPTLPRHERRHQLYMLHFNCSHNAKYVELENRRGYTVATGAKQKNPIFKTRWMQFSGSSKTTCGNVRRKQSADG